MGTGFQWCLEAASVQMKRWGGAIQVFLQTFVMCDHLSPAPVTHFILQKGLRAAGPGLQSDLGDISWNWLASLRQSFLRGTQGLQSRK